MPNVWDADIAFSPEQAAQWIADQFPELIPVTLEPLGVGWDNAAFRVNGEWVFRFPRRRVAVSLLERESVFLSRLAPFLPLPIPVPRFVGRPTASYPYPFTGYAFLSGQTACRIAWTEETRHANAPILARFLAALHTLPLPENAPGDELVKADLKKRLPLVRERLQTLAPWLRGFAIPDLIATVERLAEETPPFDPATESRWVHGDLYSRHLLADTTARLCGVIDWGDLHRGDPALDLSIAFSFLPAPARPAFRAAYGPISDAAWDRARFRAIFYGAALTLYGLDVGDDAIRRAGEDALRYA